jgi:hypothetical protein
MPGVVPGNENPSAVAAQNAAVATGGTVGNAANPASSTEGNASILGDVLNAALNVTGLKGLILVTEQIWAQLTDGRMWRSLAWIVLGCLMIFAGAAWWIGPGAERASPIALIAEGLG